MIIVNFIGNEVEKYIRGLDQYDRGQILCISGLDLPKFVEVQFSLQETGGLAERIVGITTDGVTEVEIPNYMLTNNDATSDYEIYAFVYVTNETSAETVYKITMEVNSRPKPNPYDTPEDIGMFNRVIEVMKDSVAEAENAAGTSEKNAQKTGEDRKAIEEMVGTITEIEQQVQDVKEYAGQAKTAAENALLSEQEAKKSEEASLQHRTGAEVAENNAELAEQNAKKSEQAVEQAKQLVMQMGQQVLQDKNQVAEKVEAFNKVVTDASDAINTKKNESLSAIETAKTSSVGAVEDAGTEQTQKVADEGAKQVKAVEEKGQEVLQSIPQDFATQMQNKLDKQQGSENKGKALVVGEDGNVTVGEVQGGDGIPIINTMSGASPLVVPDSAERVNKGFSIIGNTEQSQEPPPTPDNPQEIKNVGKWNEVTQKYEVDIKVTNAKESWDKEQTITITSDRPVTKWDKLVEQDGQIGWLYKTKFDSDVRPSRMDLFPIGFYMYKNHSNGVFTYACYNTKKEIGWQTSVCKQFKNVNGSYDSGTLWNYSDQPAMTSMYFNSNIATLEAFVKWMEENPLEIVYKSKESKFVPLQQSEQDAIRALKTYYPTTVITVDGGEVVPTVELTYTADTKNFILNREKAMQAQMLNIQSALISQKISGGGIKVTDSSRLPVEEFAMSGKTEQLQSTGKNLISVPDIEVGSSQQSIPCLLEKDVYISCHEKTAKVSNNIWRIRIMFKDKSSKYLTDSQMEGGSKFVCSTENPIIGIVVRGNNIESGAYRKIQVEYGSAKTNYEPYTGGKPTPSPEYPQPIEVTPQGIITVDFTDGINHQIVELNCPREFTKWDRLQKIDGVWNWVFRTCRYIITGDEEFIRAGEMYTTGSSTNFYTNVIQNAERQANGYMERLQSVNSVWSKIDETGFCINATQLHMRLPNTLLGVSDMATKEEKKTAYVNYLKAEYKKGTPYSLMYEQVVPEFIPLSQSEQDKLNALTMYASNTEITNDGGCNMELTYTVDTKSYVDAKIAEISTAVVQKGIENV